MIKTSLLPFLWKKENPPQSFYTLLCPLKSKLKFWDLRARHNKTMWKYICPLPVRNSPLSKQKQRLKRYAVLDMNWGVTMFKKSRRKIVAAIMSIFVPFLLLCYNKKPWNSRLFYYTTGDFFSRISWRLRCKIIRHIMNNNRASDNIRDFKTVG